MRLAPALACVLALACVPVLSGCGLGAGETPGAVRLVVTRDFGEQVLHLAAHPHVSGQETVMSLLFRNYGVKTRYGGGFVQSIAGLGGGEAHGRPTDWFYYVNGVEASKGAAATDVHPGDRIWWDLRDWSQTQDIPAVVGAYPEPFVHGIGGKRLPVRVECAEQGAVCQTVSARLHAAGVPSGTSALSAGGGAQILRILVGPWSALHGAPDVGAIARGPRESGVYATFGEGGATLTLLDQDGRAVRRSAPEPGSLRRHAAAPKARLGRDRDRQVRRRTRRHRAQRTIASQPLRPRGHARRRRHPAAGGSALSVLKLATRIAYRRRASPLHATRATVAAAYGGGLALAALLTENPIVLAGLLGCVLLCSRGRRRRASAARRRPRARLCRCSPRPCSSTCSSTAAG